VCIDLDYYPSYSYALYYSWNRHGTVLLGHAVVDSTRFGSILLITEHITESSQHSHSRLRASVYFMNETEGRACRQSE
jgi:hypothetical protein